MGGVDLFDEGADMPPGTGQSKTCACWVDQSFTAAFGGTAEGAGRPARHLLTSRDLSAEIAEAGSGKELYHRLNVVPDARCGLEERRDNIPRLARHSIAEFSTAKQGLAAARAGRKGIAVAMLQA